MAGRWRTGGCTRGGRGGKRRAERPAAQQNVSYPIHRDSVPSNASDKLRECRDTERRSPLDRGPSVMSPRQPLLPPLHSPNEPVNG